MFDVPGIPWSIAWLLMQLLTLIFHTVPHGAHMCQWEYVTHSAVNVHHVRHVVMVGFEYLCR